MDKVIQEPISLQEPAYSENTENIYIIDQVKDKNTDELWTHKTSQLQNQWKD